MSNIVGFKILTWPSKNITSKIKKSFKCNVNKNMTDCFETEKGNIQPQCQYFVVRKKRLCRMTVRPGRSYCGEHEPQPRTEEGKDDTRVPCPNDPKHTCYASKLEKHLLICNARPKEQPPYIVMNINAPPPPEEHCERTPLSAVPQEMLIQVIEKINRLYKEHIESQIESLPEQPIHPAVQAEFSEPGRTETSRRHLRQASALLALVERCRLLRPSTCYVELGAGKGQLSYYAARAWCERDGNSAVVAVDRAALRHKRDNKTAAALRLRGDLAHLRLDRVPAVENCEHVVGFAKHLCGVATDYALRCICAEGVLAKTRGVVIATCCHHRCQIHDYVGEQYLRALGVSAAELNVMLGIVSWATCGHGRSRDCRDRTADDIPHTDVCEEGVPVSRAGRAAAGRRAKALLEWGRARFLAQRGFHVTLRRYVPETVSLENLCIVATKDS